eukprot:CAMPEP_0119364032 /NCGR_PEP_ID=MMETSP1334-20130426/10958_1 /TAXON_ID=127549 /ORGANISM="Calcidiscus leptoporus, Strain RCC1130" /LENGTH=188 /DNA_ID=CAMNT_0007379629 /DNA_START=242 /DNA_END=805 /DNA_ORIENTATION=-
MRVQSSHELPEEHVGADDHLPPTAHGAALVDEAGGVGLREAEHRTCLWLDRVRVEHPLLGRGQVESSGASVEGVVQVDEEGEARAYGAAISVVRVVAVLVEAGAWPRPIYVRPVHAALAIGKASPPCVDSGEFIRPQPLREVTTHPLPERLDEGVVGEPFARANAARLRHLERSVLCEAEAAGGRDQL